MMDCSAPSVLSVQTATRKSPCRYGRGCTHIHDPSHLEKFRHPTKQELNADDIRRNYMCNECGLGYNSLAELRYHLQKKTAWSNESLVGCRISCLVDSKEWHEGLITHFHKSGKHCVEFRAVSEKRWFHMLKLAFYIIDPQLDDNDGHEFKENDCDGEDYSYASREEWTYFENISFDYAFTQSVLFKVYGGVVQETGHKTRGHMSLTEYDRYVARSQKGSLLYGELLPRGVNKALDGFHLDAAKAQVLFDMGMGTGKVAIQAFLQFRNLTYVYGVELSVGRYLVAEAAALRMVQLLGQESFRVDVIHGEQIVITEIVSNATDKGRTMKLQCGNMLNVKDLGSADIIMMETDIPAHLQFDLCTMLQKQMRDNASILSYHDLYKIWPLSSYPFKQLDINCSLTDRFPTSWSVQRGHHFFLFKKSNRLSSKNPFQRHLKRGIGNNGSGSGNGIGGESSSSSGSINNTISHKAAGVSCSPTQSSQCAGSPQPQRVSQFDTGSNLIIASPCPRNLSDTEYRECQAYATAFPSLPDQTHLRDSSQFHPKEIPLLNSRSRHAHTVDIVDESSCGCFFSSWLSRLFSSSRRSGEGTVDMPPISFKGKECETQLSHYSSVTSPTLSSSNMRDHPTPFKKNNKSPRSFVMTPSPRQCSVPSPSSHSPASQVKIVKIVSSSPRSVLVEQNKSPRKTPPSQDTSQQNSS